MANSHYSTNSSYLTHLHHESSPSSTSELEIEESSAKLEFSEDELTLMIRMFNLVGERWSLIAGRIPGRTAEEIEKYWTSRCSSNGC
ncbi:MYB-like transcription factor ETC1 [Impatiens glandulifera]|uniref:MYB-like transcription factor ETC1 n=1 Tax=Impatiens glandulifera TaxID=253017 RepID=UPI001FB06ED2|nr:MYB-like transcription factor ETC1 [Impatiens glandulifera]